ncbi:MAG: hypothetical protein ACJARY_001113 [Candidatus Azotimanducaceae bacterium]|jgi:hypothetical protein
MVPEIRFPPGVWSTGQVQALWAAALVRVVDGCL